MWQASSSSTNNQDKYRPHTRQHCDPADVERGAVEQTRVVAVRVHHRHLRRDEDDWESEERAEHDAG